MVRRLLCENLQTDEDEGMKQQQNEKHERCCEKDLGEGQSGHEQQLVGQ